MLSTTEQQAWGRVEAAVLEAKAVAFDDCHKIYVLMDDEQAQLTKYYGYTTMIEFDDTEENRDEALDTLREWFEESCGLRFVNAVRTVVGDANDGFTTLIGQGELDEDDEEDWTDED